MNELHPLFAGILARHFQMKPLPSHYHYVIVSKLPDAPYSSHSLYIGDYLGERCIRSQLSPYTDDEIAEYIRAYLSPSTPAQPARTHYSRPGPKAGKRESDTWRTPPTEEEQ